MKRHFISQAATQPSTNFSAPTKRFFTPSYDSKYNPAKKRRLTNGVKPMHTNYTPTNEEFQLMQIESDKQEAERQRLLNCAYYKRTSNSRDPSARGTPNTSFSGQLYDGCIQPPKHGSVQDEKLLQEIASRPKFRAKPLPRSHFVPSLLIKASERPLTIPQGFNLSSSRPSLPATTSREESNSGFKALPLNRAILERPDFEPVLDHKATTPMMIHLRTDNRSRPCSIQEGNSALGFKARPMPDFPPVFTVQSTAPLTVPMMPTLLTEQRGFLKQQAFEEQRKCVEEPPRGFISRPMPAFSPPEPRLCSFQPTQFNPFNITQPHQTKIDHEDTLTSPSFKAKPMPDFSNPFVPTLEPCDIPMSPFDLKSTQRAVLRNAFDQQVNQKSQREAAQREAEASQQRNTEAVETENYRQQLAFKAISMPNYQIFEPQHSDKALTVPRSPFRKANYGLASNYLSVMSDISTVNCSDNSVDLDNDMDLD